MTVTLPFVKLEHLAGEQLKLRKSWESNFEKNYRKFAENLSCEIEKRIVETAENRFKVSPQIKLTVNISLDITKKSVAQKIIELTEDHEDLLPFSDWVKDFSSEQKSKEEFLAERKVNQEYFDIKMVTVGGLIKQKLDELFVLSLSKNLTFSIGLCKEVNSQVKAKKLLRIEIFPKPIITSALQRNTLYNEKDSFSSGPGSCTLL